MDGRKGYEGEKVYPDGPDGHDAFHVTLALGHRSSARLTTAACRGRGNLENLVGVIDVEEQVGEAEGWNYGAHLVGLTTVVSPKKRYSICVGKPRRKGREEEYEGGGRWQKKKMMDET